MAIPMKSQLLLATVALACAALPMCAQASAAATLPPDEAPVIPEYMPESEVMFGDIAPAAQESAASAEPTAEVSSEAEPAAQPSEEAKEEAAEEEADEEVEEEAEEQE